MRRSNGSNAPRSRRPRSRFGKYSRPRTSGPSSPPSCDNKRSASARKPSGSTKLRNAEARSKNIGGVPMQVQAYLFFNGRCEEAIEFYKKALGAEVTIFMRFKDSPEPHQPGMLPPGSENKVMHVSLRVGDTTVMASDGRCTGQTDFRGFALSVTVANEAE